MVGSREPPDTWAGSHRLRTEGCGLLDSGAVGLEVWQTQDPGSGGPRPRVWWTQYPGVALDLSLVLGCLVGSDSELLPQD